MDAFRSYCANYEKVSFYNNNFIVHALCSCSVSFRLGKYAGTGNSLVPTLKKKGYKHKGWIHAERLNDFYGADFYYKNCRLNRKGEPIYFDKGNSCIIQIASVGFGPCIVIEVFNENAYWFYIKQIKAMGFQQDSSDDGTITYVRRKTAIDRARKGGSFCIRRNL